jgi:peroxiredoxin
VRPVVLGWALVAALVAGTPARAENPRLLDVAGKQVSITSLQTDVTVIDFWGTFCPPCLDELPSLQALHDAVAPRVAVLAVSVDAPESHDRIRAVAAAKKLTLPLLHDVDHALLGRYFKRMAATGNISVPQLVVVDRRGRGFATSGYDPDQKPADFIVELRAVIARVMSGERRIPVDGWTRIGW